MKKQNIIAVIIFLFILTCATGYAIFKTNIEVEGKGGAAQNFDVIFTKAVEIDKYQSENAYATISYDKKKVFITVPELLEKGAYSRFEITVKNVGNINAKLFAIREFIYTNDNALDVTYDHISIFDKAMKPNEERIFYVTVSWKRDTKESDSNINFVIDLDYTQD